MTTTKKILYPTRRAQRAQQKKQPKKYEWDAERVRALREHMGLTQTQFAEELGILQQTVSQWECGYHYPKGASVKVLSMVAERAKFKYGEKPPPDEADKTGA
jgi:DNA-binding transcriptional regulator YiaG